MIFIASNYKGMKFEKRLALDEDEENLFHVIVIKRKATAGTRQRGKRTQDNRNEINAYLDVFMCAN